MNIQVEQLQVGQIIKNYKELCAILDIPVKSGNTKIAQFKDIEQYCKLIKDGKKFTVTEIYVEPIKKIDGRVNTGGYNKVDYIESIEDMILHQLACDGGHLCQSKSSLMFNSGFYNEEYKLITHNVGDVCEEFDCSASDLFDWNDSVYPLLRNRLLSAIKSLVDRGLVISKEVRYLYNKGDHELVEVTPEQILQLDEYKETSLAKWNCKNLSEVFFKRKSDLYYRTYYGLIIENMGYDMEFSMFDIDLIDKSKLCEYFLDKQDDVLNTINESIRENIMNNARKRHDKADTMDIYAPENKYKVDKIKYRSSSEYVKNYEKLCMNFLCLNYSDEIEQDDVVSIVLPVQKATKDTIDIDYEPTKDLYDIGDIANSNPFVLY